MIGSELFLDFETAFNINGPEGCFSACYDYFERIIECEDHDPVHAEALRRLAMAKAWSSAYDQAVVHCEALIAAKISQASTELGRAGLTEMIQFRESRQKKIRERLDATQNR